MMKRQWVVVLGGAACLVAATFLSGLADEAQGCMMHDQMHGGHDQEEQDDHSAHYLKHLLKHAKEIGLTPEQISAPSSPGARTRRACFTPPSK